MALTREDFAGIANTVNKLLDKREKDGKKESVDTIDFDISGDVLDALYNGRTTTLRLKKVNKEGTHYKVTLKR